MTDLAELSAAQRQQFRDEGYVVLERVIPDRHLQLLRDVCADSIASIEAEMRAADTEVAGLNHLHKRYFIPMPCKSHPEVKEFYFGDVMAAIVRGTLGPEAYLYLDQYTVKGPEAGLKFAWHQDSGYVGFPHAPTLTCWCALDDMSAANGTLSVLPFSRAGTREIIEHVKEEGSNDLVGYFGDDPGDLVEVPAGSVLAFSSTMLHRSGANTSPSMRRALTIEYSAEPMRDPKTGDVLFLAEHFLHDGQCVASVAPAP